MNVPIRRFTAAAVLLLAPIVSLSQPVAGAVTTIDRFSLILYAFDSDEPGALNQRILDEYVLPEVGRQSEVAIVGYSDVVGQEVHNRELALRRARKVAARIDGALGDNGYRSLLSTAAGEESAPYRFDLPEGRLLSRTVVITVRTRGAGRTWTDADREE